VGHVKFTPFANSVSTAAIVCAYNEESRISRVLRVLVSYPEFQEIIVVDDGSVDGTAHEASLFPVRVLRHEENRGKGGAMTTGIQATTAQIIFICDADIKGLTHNILDDIIGPVRQQVVEMMIAQRWNIAYALPFVPALAPRLSGVRAFRRTLWDAIPSKHRKRYMVEAAMNHFGRTNGYRVRYATFRNMSHVIKERKHGAFKGLIARLKMCSDVVWITVRLKFEAAFWS
jgi:glycosyltransferase involved in cell wall biosynthesis